MVIIEIIKNQTFNKQQSTCDNRNGFAHKDNAHVLARTAETHRYNENATVCDDDDHTQ